MNPKSPCTTVKGTRLRETAKAVQFTVTHIGGKEIEPKTEWFPFSQVNKSVTGKTDGEDWMQVSEWILRQKGYDV